MKTRIVIFCSRDDLDAGFVRAKNLEAELQRLGSHPRFIDKTGFNLDDLHMVARYRVVATPCILILSADEVVYRSLKIPQARDLLAFQERWEYIWESEEESKTK